MKRTITAAIVFLTALSLTAAAATISGKVSGVSGTSVVYVDVIQGKTFSAPAKHALIDQKGLLFHPHVLVIQQGTTVDFLNSDSVAHNVFWPSISGNRKEGHNLGTWPKDQKKSFQFNTSGVVPLLCNVHPEMSGYIIVSPTPYFAETNSSGEYKIDDVPDGNYKVAAWHEGAKPQSKQIDVKGETKADFTLSK